MAYNPSLYSPYGQQPINGLIRVAGIESVMAYPQPPSSALVFFNENEDLMYVKRTDAVGFPTVETFQFSRVENTPNNSDYVSREEFNRLLKRLEEKEERFESEGKHYAEQSIQQNRRDERQYS